MPAYDFLSGVASAVEKQSNALQAYGLQKREQEREQQERTQYNQVFTELGQFLASGQEIPEERIQTWTQMMGAAPTEIVTAFSNAMNTLGNRREEQQYRTAQTGIAQEGLNLQKQQLRQGASEFDRRLADAVAERTWRSGEADLDRKAQRQIAGMSRAQQNDITERLISMVSSSGAAGGFDPNSLASLLNEVLEKKGFTQRVRIDTGSGIAKTPQQYITEATNSIGAANVSKTLLIQWLSNKQSQSRVAGNNEEVNALQLAIDNISSLPDAPVETTREDMSRAWVGSGSPATRSIR